LLPQKGQQNSPNLLLFSPGVWLFNNLGRFKKTQF
jgi:hypothetical protein